jgi:hypothetical protein
MTSPLLLFESQIRPSHICDMGLPGCPSTRAFAVLDDDTFMLGIEVGALRCARL